MLSYMYFLSLFKQLNSFSTAYSFVQNLWMDHGNWLLRSIQLTYLYPSIGAHHRCICICICIFICICNWLLRSIQLTYLYPSIGAHHRCICIFICICNWLLRSIQLTYLYPSTKSPPPLEAKPKLCIAPISPQQPNHQALTSLLKKNTCPAT